MLYKTLGELGSDGTNDCWRRGSAQNASRFSAMARDGDGRGRDLVNMRVTALKERHF